MELQDRALEVLGRIAKATAELEAANTELVAAKRELKATDEWEDCETAKGKVDIAKEVLGMMLNMTVAYRQLPLTPSQVAAAALQETVERVNRGELDSTDVTARARYEKALANPDA